MNAIIIHREIQVLKQTIRDIEKTLKDRRIKEPVNNGTTDRRKMVIARRKDTITSKIFDNTVRYNMKHNYPDKTTEKFVDGVRSGEYG